MELSLDTKRDERLIAEIPIRLSSASDKAKLSFRDNISDPARFKHMRVDQGIVPGDIGMERCDIADSAHIGMVIDLVDCSGRQEGVILSS